MVSKTFIVIIDQDLDYRTALSLRISQQWPGQCYALDSVDALPDLMQLSPRFLLILCDRRDSLRINSSGGVADASQSRGRRPELVIVTWDFAPTADSLQPYRLMPVSQLMNWLMNRLLQPPFLKAKELVGYLLAVNLGWSGHEAWISQQIALAQANGREIYYLPLMPTYRMTRLAKPGSGPNLTALILQLRNGAAVQVQDIGHYLEPHPDGYWQFRPPDGAEDLQDMPSSELRQLIDLIRQRKDDALLIVDCQAISLKKVAALAVSAHQIAARFMAPVSWADQIAQRELTALLNKLPNSCSIIEMEDPDDAA